MKGVTLVENEDWAYLPFIQTKDVVGKGLNEIYSEYKETLNENLHKKKIDAKENKKNEKRFRKS